MTPEWVDKGGLLWKGSAAAANPEGDWQQTEKYARKMRDSEV